LNTWRLSFVVDKPFLFSVSSSSGSLLVGSRSLFQVVAAAAAPEIYSREDCISISLSLESSFGPVLQRLFFECREGTEDPSSTAAKGTTFDPTSGLGEGIETL
jgi:hypothetical protein